MFVRTDALNLLNRILIFATANGFIRNEEERTFHYIQKTLAIPDVEAKPLLDRLNYLKYITYIRRGRLPTAYPSIRVTTQVEVAQAARIRPCMLFVQAVRPTNLKIENPALLAHYAQAYIRKKTTEGTMKPPFTCEVVVVLGGNIVKSGDRYITTSYEKGTKKSFGAQGRVITSAFLYHLGVSDCLILSTGKTDPEDKGAPSEASVMKAELMAFGVPETCIHLEEQSRTTEEKARELVKLFTTETFKEKRTIGVITSSWHIRRTDAFLKREGFHAEGRKIKFISSDTMISRYLPEFRDDIHRLYHRQEMKDRIHDERNGYNALKNGTYRSRKLGEIVATQQPFRGIRFDYL